MYKLAILSQDAHTYRQLLQQADLPNLSIEWADTQPKDKLNYAQLDILFGDPDLCAKIIHKCSKLTWLQSTWAGNAPLFAAAKTDYQLCGVKGVFHQAMQEYVLAYLLYFSRNIQGFKQAQQNHSWQKVGFSTLAGKTLGIMGVGDIGQAVAKMAKNFAMTTKGFTRTSSHCEYIDEYYTQGQEQHFAKDLDFLLCLLPDSPATFNLIDAQFLSYLPKHGILINAGRGSCIDDQALVNALNTQALHAAVLDVFDQEPLPNEHAFWQTDNLYITQHTAAKSNPLHISPLFIDNYLRFTAGQSLNYRLDFVQGY